MPRRAATDEARLVADIELLIRAIVPELLAFESKHSTAVVSKLGLLTKAAQGSFILALDTKDNDWRPKLSHPRVALLHDKPELADLVRRAKADADPVLLAGAAALDCIEGMGHLPFEIEDEIDFLVLDGDETEAVARKRMKKASLWLTGYPDRSRFGSI